MRATRPGASGYNPGVRRSALVLVVLLGTAPSCAPEPRRVLVVHTETAPGHLRHDRRMARENRALRREVRRLHEELEAVRQAALAQAEVQSAERQQQASTSNELTDRIGELAATIERLEKVLRMEAPPSAQGRRGGSFSKVRLGSVPAQTPTPPEPRQAMDAPARPQGASGPEPFEKAPAPNPETFR
jgi:hypothetical protein